MVHTPEISYKNCGTVRPSEGKCSWKPLLEERASRGREIMREAPESTTGIDLIPAASFAGSHDMLHTQVRRVLLQCPENTIIRVSRFRGAQHQLTRISPNVPIRSLGAAV